jgi:putative FmdB family regulatory protein
MPHYEFLCNACKKPFSKILTIAEHDAEKTACPHCGSHEVGQSWSAFSAVTSKKSA